MLPTQPYSIFPDLRDFFHTTPGCLFFFCGVTILCFHLLRGSPLGVVACSFSFPPLAKVSNSLVKTILCHINLLSSLVRPLVSASSKGYTTFCPDTVPYVKFGHVSTPSSFAITFPPHLPLPPLNFSILPYVCCSIVLSPHAQSPPRIAAQRKRSVETSQQPNFTR